MVNTSNNPADASGDGLHETKLEGEASNAVESAQLAEQKQIEAEVAVEREREINPEVRDFYERYKSAMIAWFKTPGRREQPPIGELPVFDKDGNKVGTKLHWFNRAERRKLRKPMRLPRAHNYR